MFDLAERPLVWIAVKWSILKPSEEADKTAVEHEVSVELEVEVKDRDELIVIAGDMFGLTEGEEKPKVADKRTPLELAAAAREKEVDQFLLIVSNWRKLADGGKPVAFDRANVKRILAIPGFTNGFQTAYFLACAGKTEAREGN